MIRKILAVALGVTVAASALAAVSADEAKQLGTTLTAVGAEKAANKDGTIPAYSGGLTTPPASYKKGDGYPPRSVCRREAAPHHHRQGRWCARGQAHRGHEGAAEALSDHARGRVLRRIARSPTRSASLDNTMKNATGAKTTDDGVALDGRRATPASRSRSRRPATKRCGTTCCATAARATTIAVRRN